MIIYRRRRYDFEPALAQGLTLHRAGSLGAARLVACLRPKVLEINEPLMSSSLPTTLAVLLTLDALRFMRIATPSVVTYAIENHHAIPAAGASWRRKLRQTFEARTERWVSRKINKVVFGTPGSRTLYQSLLPELFDHAAVNEIPALPKPCECLKSAQPAPGACVFVGQFSARKGVRELMAAWPTVVEQLRGAHLTLLGKGELLDDVLAFAADRPEVTVVVDPSRESVHEHLRSARVLVLLSQRFNTWREQVGLPIVEGLAHGCAVVTTEETGLAGWLTESGHGVVSRDATRHDVVAALLNVLENGPSRSTVLHSLPQQDGRLAADQWLTADALDVAVVTVDR